MKEQNKEVQPQQTPPQQIPPSLEEGPKPGDQRMRQIIIETDGNTVKLIKCETPGSLELKAVLTTIISNL